MDRICSSNPLVISPSSEIFGSFSAAITPASSAISFLLFSLLGTEEKVSGLFTNISIIQSWNWFFHLTAFESVLLFFVLSKIIILELLGILPINLTEFWEGNAAGRRRKKRAFLATPSPLQVAHTKKEIGAQLLTLYRKLDKNECGFRALCELESEVIQNSNYKTEHVSPSTQLVLKTLLAYAEMERYHNQGNKRNESNSGDNAKNSTNGNVNADDLLAVLRPFAEAVKIGYDYGLKHKSNCSAALPTNSSLFMAKPPANECQIKFSTCPVTSDEVLDYLKQINLLLHGF